MVSDANAQLGAVRAKTILAACDRVALVDASGAVGCRLIGLIERDGAVFVVPAAGERMPSGVFRLTCLAEPAGLGALELTARAGAVAGSSDLPGFVHTVTARRVRGGGAPRPEWSMPESMDLAEAMAVELTIEAVRVLVMVPGIDRARPIPVAVSDFRSARPDQWLLDGGRTAAHLDQYHQPELRLLVGCGSDTSVVASRIGIDDMDLACLGPEGVGAFTVRFGERIDRPVAVCYWLTRTVRAA